MSVLSKPGAAARGAAQTAGCADAFLSAIVTAMMRRDDSPGRWQRKAPAEPQGLMADGLASAPASTTSSETWYGGTDCGEGTMSVYHDSDEICGSDGAPKSGTAPPGMSSTAKDRADVDRTGRCEDGITTLSTSDEDDEVRISVFGCGGGAAWAACTTTSLTSEEETEGVSHASSRSRAAEPDWSVHLRAAVDRNFAGTAPAVHLTQYRQPLGMQP